MSLPDFSTQAELLSTAALSASLFASPARYRLFAKLVYPRLAASRAALEQCYCADNGRVALKPVLMLGVSVFSKTWRRCRTAWRWRCCATTNRSQPIVWVDPFIVTNWY